MITRMKVAVVSYMLFCLVSITISSKSPRAKTGREFRQMYPQLRKAPQSPGIISSRYIPRRHGKLTKYNSVDYSIVQRKNPGPTSLSRRKVNSYPLIRRSLLHTRSRVFSVSQKETNHTLQRIYSHRVNFSTTSKSAVRFAGNEETNGGSYPPTLSTKRITGARNNFLTKRRQSSINQCRTKKYGECCKGWIRHSLTSVCMPNCAKACVHGTCRSKFSCKCNEGFTGPLCDIDVNECAFVKCEQGCLNTHGSYRCICDQGFVMQKNGHCREMDPCEVQKCQYKCYGSREKAKCLCPRGYHVAKNGRTCVDINECKERNVLCYKGDSRTCRNLPGSYVCGCKEGYFFHRYFKTCYDSDECLMENHNCDVTRANCINTLGSYRCECRGNYVGDGITCNDTEQGLVESLIYQCHPKALSVVERGGRMCRCMEGYEGDGYTCEDTNECLEKNSRCAKGTEYCVNTIGSYHCKCRSGFTSDGQSCQRTRRPMCSGARETKSVHCHPRAICVNGDCECQVGFHGNGTHCEDIDECASCEQRTMPQYLEPLPPDNILTETRSDGAYNRLSCCEHKCVNSYGSYRCLCDHGYEADVFMGKCRKQ